MHGITLSTYRAYADNPNLTADDLKAISDEDVAAIYKKQYWIPCHCDALSSGLDLAVFNFAVNAGVTHCAHLLQSVVGVPSDGIWGPTTVAAANSMPNATNRFLDAIEVYYRSLPTFDTFGHGWITRTEAVRSIAERNS
jgi:lysozyme family protein